MKSARSVATEILTKIEKDNAFSNIVLSNQLEKSGLEPKDKALCSALVYGVLTRKLTLDAVISKFATKKAEKFVQNVLRVAAFQLLFMDKIPTFAAVNEAILTLKANKMTRQTGFVNAILRKISESDALLPENLQTAEELSVAYSVNPDFAAALIKNYGFSVATEFLKASIESPKLFVRVNTLVTTADELISRFAEENIVATKCDTENALIIENAGDLKASKCYSDGLFHVQDLSSQIAISKLDIRKNMRLLDICSAPGGKSFTAAQYLENTGEILSCDLYEHRVKLVSEGAKRLKINNLQTAVSDASVFNQQYGKFDRIICDVPCSGFGVIRRKPEIRYKKLDDFKELPKLQYNILKNASDYLKEDGILMYSTCTLRKTENERVVEKFVRENPQFKIEYMKTLMPQTDGSDGFFICLLRR